MVQALELEGELVRVESQEVQNRRLEVVDRHFVPGDEVAQFVGLTDRDAAFDAAAKVLKEGDLLCIFPEGGLTRDGTVQEFKGGIMKILERTTQQGTAVQVVPMALTNLWGSFFSRVEQGGAMVRPFRRGIFSRVGLNVGAAVPPADVTPHGLRGRVQALLGDASV